MVGNLEVWTGCFLGSTTENSKLTQTRNYGVCSVLCVAASHKIAQTPMHRINEVYACLVKRLQALAAAYSRSPCDPLAVTDRQTQFRRGHQST